MFTRYKTSDMTKLKKMNLDFEIRDVSFKHRYIFIVRDRKNILKNLKHKILSYPKQINNK